MGKKNEQIYSADFGSTFTWMAGLSVFGAGAAAVAGLAGFRKLNIGSTPEQQKKLLLLAAGATITPMVTSIVGLACVYCGMPGFKPSFGWERPDVSKMKASEVGRIAKEKYNKKKVEEKGPWDVIVVGSGMGGLSCASVLAQLGYKVLVLEAHEVAGGSTHDYNVDGKTQYKFPSGLHYTIPMSEEMLQAACGSRRPPIHFGRMGDDTIKKDGAYDRVKLTRTKDETLRVITDVQVMKELRKRFPGLNPQLDKVEKASAAVLTAFPLWCSLHAFPWGIRLTLMKMLLPASWWNYAGRTGEDVLEECFKDAPESERENVYKCQGYLCGLFLDSGSPPHEVSFFMLAATTLGFPHEGGAYPEGGSGEMGRVLTQRVEAAGGAVFVRAPVAKIIIDEKSGRATGVKMIDQVGGDEWYAKKCVVSACGFRNTARLCKGSAFPSPEDLPLAQGGGWVMANIGIKGSAEKLGLECANMELLPAGNGMSIFEGCKNFFNKPLDVPPTEIPMMITFPTVKDRRYHDTTNGKNGDSHETCQLLVLAKTEWFGKIPEPAVGTVTTPAWQHPERLPNYEKLKQQWTDRLRTALLAEYPQLKDSLDMFDVSTPLTIEHYLPTVSGSAIGLDTSAGESCRFTNFKVMKMLDMKTPVPGLWMTGQDALMIGVPLAQAAGLITAMRIAGPLQSLRFVVRTVWLLVSGLGEKARSGKKQYLADLAKMREEHMPR